jgi:hypothetical protein
MEFDFHYTLRTGTRIQVFVFIQDEGSVPVLSWPTDDEQIAARAAIEFVQIAEAAWEVWRERSRELAEGRPGIAGEREAV